MRPAQVPSNTAPNVLSRDGTGGRRRQDSEVTPAARITGDNVEVIVTGCYELLERRSCVVDIAESIWDARFDSVAKF